MKDRYWPFAVPPTKQHTDQQLAVVRFLETAHSQGFRPFVRGESAFGAGFADGRCGCIVSAGTERWELVLGERGERVLWATLDSFLAGTAGLLPWLRGEDAGVLVAVLGRRLIRSPGLWYRYWLAGVHYQ